ncbi:Esterase PHB depolymerase [Oceanospirillum multiglobuliferum]|uniref:Poly(3-hydroxybutyrate) depolymerase n=1 Tax=Oceanospirillum multiglobuliferum TaxID=64969 RepID=A0A1T4S037_9GAMM|nr:PHB depolymerase family esterase [Oceanospirillum multiglobuliferum]OPX54534.1 hypothetical protein BTE48_13670 [Oceanospirillum multiglobuliferum]SKA21639.1 Esterase PHB depolymerase [Oceanospirillum multiglobuliferum]
MSDLGWIMYRFSLQKLVFLLPVVFLLSVIGCSQPETSNHLPALQALTSLHQSRVTVSGFSSGGYLANQLHLAYPELIEGAAIFSAGPWGCAMKGLSHALMSCMQTRFPIADIDDRMAMLHRASRKKEIGDPALLVDDPVYIFYGQKDDVLKPAVSESLINFYQTIVASYNIRITAMPQAGHAFPSVLSTQACGSEAAPYFQNCHFDGAAEALRVLFGQLQAPSDSSTGQLIEFDQRKYYEGKGMLDRGYLYLPSQCSSGARECQLHVVLHGCGQSSETLKTVFIEQSGYKRWADSNGIVLLYPQASKSLVNPQGCWDWWGYEKGHFYARDNPQLSAITGMIKTLAR